MQCTGEIVNMYRCLIVKYDGQRPLGRLGTSGKKMKELKNRVRR